MLLYRRSAEVDAMTSDPSQDDELYAKDLAASAPTAVTYAAAALCALTAVAFAFLGIQTRAILLSMTFIGEVATLAMFAGAVVLAIVATQLLRLELWAAIAGILASVVLAIGSVAWLIVSTSNGLFSVLAWLCPGASVASVVTTALAAPACKRARGARRRMKARSIS